MADSYVQSLLGDDETIRSEASQHPAALVRFALQPLLILLAAFIGLAVGIALTPSGDGLFNDISRWIDTLLGLLTAGLFILAVVWLPVQAFRWTRRRYLVTDRRVLYVEGVLRRSSVDAGLNMITDVAFRQGVLGRQLGYGDLVVSTASARPLIFRQMRDALEYKKAIMAAQHATIEARADEILVAQGRAPALASVAATPVEAPPAPPADAAPPETAPTAPAAEPAPPPAPAWDGSDVPQMSEDDLPPADPLVFGTPGQAPDDEDRGIETKPAAPLEPAADIPHMAEDDTPPVDPLVHGGPVAAMAEALPEHEAFERTAAGAVEPVVEATAGIAEESEELVTEAIEVKDAGVQIKQEGIEGVEGPVATPAASVEDAPPVAPAGGHTAALDEVDTALAGIADGAKGTGAEAVTAALARLADLRDTGAITAEEFESRKQELLDRL
jgi:membrane protein YdbS with pleckstrin-like domain